MPELTLAEWLVFLAASGLLAVTPGPGIAYVLARTASGGWTEGMASVLGTGVGGLVHVSARAAGLSFKLAAGQPLRHSAF
jgi:threonine/homoserine/homoserine lactone efflux protein